VSEKLQADVKSGAIFAFTNKRRTRLKVIYWDKTGLWLMTKRLEKGTFCWPRSAEALGNIIPADFSGIIGCDGYSVYQSRAAHSDGRIRLAACWAHVRRKFDEAK
jgi:hypothetical protein